MKHRALKFLGATLIVLSLASFFGCQAIQRKVLFFPSNHANANGFTRWEHEGATIGYAREVAAPSNVWLMLHGNGGQAADRTYAMHAFDERDSIYILEYPGYGERAGTPSRRGFDAAAREGYAALRARFPGKPVCVLVVPFDDIKSVARDHVRYLPVGLILAGTWDNVDALKDYKGPIEVFGAEKDEVIPVKHARALAESLPQAKFHLIPINHGWANLRGVAFRNP